MGAWCYHRDLLWIGRKRYAQSRLKRDIHRRHPIDRINLRTAPADVIQAMTGLPFEKSRAIVEERKKLSERTLQDLLRLLGVAAGDAMVRQFVFVSPTVITIETAGREQEASATERRIKAVVRVVQGSQGMLIVRWIDHDFSRN
jgi:hypothetical protein